MGPFLLDLGDDGRFDEGRVPVLPEGLSGTSDFALLELPVASSSDLRFWPAAAGASGAFTLNRPLGGWLVRFLAADLAAMSGFAAARPAFLLSSNLRCW